MVNNFSDLVAALKAWWHAPIKFERKQPEPMTPEEFKKLPTSILDLISNGPMQKYKDQYYSDLQARFKAGERLNSEEMYRLRMHRDIDHLNFGLEYPDDFWKD